MPVDFDAAQTFDLFLKLHFVFDTEFQTNLIPMVNFLLHFVFQMKVPKFVPSTKMKEVFNKLSKDSVDNAVEDAAQLLHDVELTENNVHQEAFAESGNQCVVARPGERTKNIRRNAKAPAAKKK